MVKNLLLFTFLAFSAHSWGYERVSGEVPATLQTFDGVSLSAIWTIPNVDPKAVAVILPGSGNVGLDGDVSSPPLGYGYKGQEAKLSQQVAATLAQAGVASLRYSKRGFEDAAQLANQTMPYLLKDAESAMTMARQRFAQAKIIYIGFSEGASLALKAATENPVDALFLFGPPTRAIDDIVAYQAIEWPLEVLRTQVDADSDGILTANELAVLSGLPGYSLLGMTWQELDTNGDGALTIETEGVVGYRKFHSIFMTLLQGPGFGPWFKSLQEFPSFSSLATQIKAPTYIYQALDDAQINASWAVADASYFSNLAALRTFAGFGHCFSPMDGAAGEIKTSGPIDARVLQALLDDVQAL